MTFIRGARLSISSWERCKIHVYMCVYLKERKIITLEKKFSYLEQMQHDLLTELPLCLTLVSARIRR